MAKLIDLLKKLIVPISTDKAAEEQQHEPEPALRAELQIPQALIDRYEASQHQNDRYNRWKKKVDALTIFSLVLTAVATGITAVAAKRAVDVAVDNSHLDQRAWVGLGPIDILNKPIAGETLKVHAKVENSGRSPAVHLLPASLLAPLRTIPGETRVPLLDRDELAACRGPKPQWSDDLGGSLLLPQAENASIDRSSPILNASLVQALTISNTPITPSEQEMHDIPALGESPETKNWIVGLYLVGCINYFDAFRQAHRTLFCLIYAPSSVSSASPNSPNGYFASCPKGDDGD